MVIQIYVNDYYMTVWPTRFAL